MERKSIVTTLDFMYYIYSSLTSFQFNSQYVRSPKKQKSTSKGNESVLNNYVLGAIKKEEFKQRDTVVRSKYTLHKNSKIACK